MKNPIGRIVLTLAASAADPSELQKFFTWIERVGPETATQVIQNLRDRTQDIEHASIGKSRQNIVGGKMPSNIEVADRLERLLLSETGLNKQHAVELILHELETLGIQTKELPAHHKISFSIWLERVARRVGPNQLLQVASRIRNSVAHGKLHWPLRRDDA
jgi:hypothetical protein